MNNPKNEGGAARAGDAPDNGRRRFLAVAILGLGAAGAAIVTVPAVAFVLGPLLRKKPRTWRSVGAVDSFEVGKTAYVKFENAGTRPWDGMTGSTAAWLRRETEQEFIAFSVNCAHLGCPVRWEPKAELFLCPCHGGVYYKNGDVAAGPPPRPLFRYNVRVRGGEVEIQTGPLPMV
jgi:menaquinol-cytochrome c reductase iron-sulfur subunit